MQHQLDSSKPDAATARTQSPVSHRHEPLPVRVTLAGPFSKRMHHCAMALGLATTCSAALGACSGESNSEQGNDAGSGGSSAAAGSSGSPSVAGATSQGGTGAQGGRGNGGESGGDSDPMGGRDDAGAPGTGGADVGSCSARSSFTLAVHMVVEVDWPGTLGTQAGSGDFHIWNRLSMSADGTALTGRSSPCGSALPPLTLTVLVGGGMSLLEIPTEVWDMPSFPDFPSSASLSGWDPGSTLSTNPTTNLVGSMMDDVEADWPASSTGLTPVDVDRDDNPGITSIPRMGNGYNRPPVSIVGPRAERIYLTSRTATSLEGVLSSCTEISGSARLERLDSHVLGCQTDEGEPCTAGQTQFLDDNRTRYTMKPGTFSAQIVDDDISCTEIRAMLPM